MTNDQEVPADWRPTYFYLVVSARNVASGEPSDEEHISCGSFRSRADAEAYARTRAEKCHLRQAYLVMEISDAFQREPGVVARIYPKYETVAPPALPQPASRDPAP